MDGLIEVLKNFAVNLHDNMDENGKKRFKEECPEEYEQLMKLKTTKPMERDIKAELQVEANELERKASKLLIFLDKGKPDFIDDEQWGLMQDQSHFMQEYYNVLTKRMELL